MGRNLNKGGEGIKTVCTEAIQSSKPELCIFNVTTAYLCLSVACILERKEYIYDGLPAYCEKSSIQSLFFHTLFET